MDETVSRIAYSVFGAVALGDTMTKTEHRTPNTEHRTRSGEGMDAAATTAIRFNRLLPYWAVLQTDLRQTLRSWVWRLWVLIMLLAAGGYVLYKFGAAKAGEFQPASVQTDDLLRALAVGSLSLVSLLAVSSISSERGTVADSVLSRGISRHQYFLAKWHARLAAILSTFIVTAGLALIAYALLFNETVTGGGTNLTLIGGLLGILILAAALAVVVSWGVAIGSMTNGTVLGITIFWIAIFGGMLLLTQLPAGYPNPKRTLDGLRNVLRGEYATKAIGEFLLLSLGLSTAGAMIGLAAFSRRDV
jgi:ABC-type transport system involved in multi-copper enzyme maturation permease subunit